MTRNDLGGFSAWSVVVIFAIQLLQVISRFVIICTCPDQWSLFYKNMDNRKPAMPNDTTKLQCMFMPELESLTESTLLVR